MIESLESGGIMDVSQRIIQLRERRNWSQRELAKRIKINVSVMNRIESGERPLKDHELAELSRVLETTTDYLLGLSDNPRLTADEEFRDFTNDPDLNHFFRDIEASEEQEQHELKQIWEIIKQRRSDKGE